MNFYIDGLQTGIDLRLEANLTTNVSVGGRTEGDIGIECYNSATKKPVDLGLLHVNLLRYDNYMSNTEVFISEIPSTFHMELSMHKNTEASYQASSSVEYYFIKIGKMLDGEWYHTFVLFHELPTQFEVSVRSNSDYTIDKPLPLQGLPELKVDCSSSTMDIIAHSTGRASGQRGNVDLHIENVKSLHGRLIGDSYRITSEGIDYLKIKITDLPLMKNFKVRKLELLGEDLRSIEFELSTLFGVYPIFEISELDGRAFEINLENDMDLFGSRRHVSITLMDITYTSVGGADIPSETPFYRNGVSLEMDKNKRHVLVPAPITTLIGTSLS
jgi:hypothetical protein